MSGDARENQRDYPRISIPLLVELKHPILGMHRTTAENISAGGVYVLLPDDAQADRVKPESRLKLRLLNASQIGPQATPTVEMVVTRVDSAGLGLKFANETNRFLWESAKRQRVELAVGRDYFQVYMSALVQQGERLLLVEERGHWVFPGCYLQVGESWQDALTGMLSDGLGLADCEPLGPADINNHSDPRVPEVATLRVFYRFQAQSRALQLSEDTGYRDSRWVEKVRTLDELTFANAEDRRVVEQELRSLQQSPMPADQAKP